jgi:hypothetical protein
MEPRVPQKRTRYVSAISSITITALPIRTRQEFGYWDKPSQAAPVSKHRAPLADSARSSPLRELKAAVYSVLVHLALDFALREQLKRSLASVSLVSADIEESELVDVY